MQPAKLKVMSAIAKKETSFFISSSKKGDYYKYYIRAH